MELRNKLNAATGLRLPVTVVFEQPTPEALAELVIESLFPTTASEPVPADLAPLPLDVAEADALELLRLIDAELDDSGTSDSEAGR